MDGEGRKSQVPPENSAANLHFSDSDDDDESGDNSGAHPADYSHYSQQMEELFNDGGQEDITRDVESGDDSDDDDAGFVYSGIDAPDISVSYHDQLRDVLDQGQSDESGHGPHEFETSLVLGDDHEPLEQFEYSEEVLSNASPSTTSVPMTPPSRVDSPGLLLRSPRHRTFLHPTVSRLRSYTPQPQDLSPPHREHSNPIQSQLFDTASPSPSRFSSMSRASSVSNLRATSSNGHNQAASQREVFRWSELHSITNQVFSKASQKASSLLGKLTFSTPTVIVANGMICLGLEDGRILVYDFKQTLKAVCGVETIGLTMGAVTALALSHDHTCVASGHANGHIMLYDLKKPSSPMRSVAPTTIAAISTGRKEGHLQGSRIVSIGFIAGRHTALVSADEHGLAFYHSLGKVLFVEAPDILRILGQYPDPTQAAHFIASPSSAHPTAPLNGHRRVRYAILSMAHLPLGTTPHTTDAYDVVALLTPTKLVVVGLRPSPKTWFKCPRQPEEGGLSKSKMKGVLAWFPSVARPSLNPQVATIKQKAGVVDGEGTTDPILAYSWGNSLRFIKVMEARFKQRVRSSKTGKTSEIEVGTIVHEPIRSWVADETITALQWLHANQIVFVTATAIAVYDLQLSGIIEQSKFDGLSLMSPTLNRTVNGSVSFGDAAADTAHSLRIYKGKMFLLARDRMLVGTMLTWADRILSLVESGDFLSAIELCRTYYTNEAPGNRNGLPEDHKARQGIIGDKLRNLMEASANYAFSEDRMTDDTHKTPDHRGVDLTSLFEGLVSTCCRASVALDDFDFLFEDLFQMYDDTGISTIYLRQLEPFILDNEIRHVPPRITQRLIALHEANGQPEYVERIIWHMDPACLDLNQTIHLCQKVHLYDALIYIYTRALQDYVAPAVELLGLIRRIQQVRQIQMMGLHDEYTDDEAAMDTLVVNAYKIYPYLSNVLSGFSYPSEEPLPEGEANSAKKAVYSFIFFGRSSVWPPGNEGKLVLTAIEEGGVEPTYPYARQLLRFDSEAFLHSLDIAFEDPFLNDESQSVNRLVIVRILLEILADEELSAEDVTFIHIFIARNVPKYIQFLPIAPTILHNILTGLAEDPDPSTREDRQLAAEYLLSVYNPHESEYITALFEEAGFYRILRTWYRQDRRWSSLFSTYINDDRLHPADLFLSTHNILVSATQNRRPIPSDIAEVFSESLPRLLRASISNTATLVDIHTPQFHQDTISVLKAEFREDADEACYIYLKQLFIKSEDEEVEFAKVTPDPAKFPPSLLKTFVDLQVRLHPQGTISILESLDPCIQNWTEIIDICEKNESWSTVLWALDWKNESQAAMKKSEHYHRQLVRRVIQLLASDGAISPELDLLKAIGLIGRDICLRRSQTFDQVEEDLWFGLLSSQIHAVQAVSSSGLEDGERFQGVLVQLRTLVQTTFTALVSITSTQAVSFPRLFKRLVDSTPTATGTHYTEFRLILGGMLESYRCDADLLDITKRLVGRDLFDSISRYTTAKNKGWAPSRGICNVCRQPLLQKIGGPKQQLHISLGEIIVSQEGTISHKGCWSSGTDERS